MDLFSRMEFFFFRLEKYIRVRPSAAMTDVMVKIMIEVITILGIVTKEVRQGRTSMSFLVFLFLKIDLRAERYLKSLVGRKDIESALQRLEKLTQEEVRMAIAETLTISRDIEVIVKDVDKRLEGVDETVQDIDCRVKDVDHMVKDVGHIVKGVDQRLKGVGQRLKGVDRNVFSVIKGELCFHRRSPKLSSALNSVRCNGDRICDSTSVKSS